MAHVEKRGPRKYRARYRGPDGKERSKTFTTEREAKRFLTSVEHSKDVGAYVDPKRSRLTVGAWADEWRAGRVHLKPSTLASYDSLLTTQVRPTWGDIPLGRVSNADVVAWVASMRKSGLSASRMRQAYHLFTSMLDAAVSDNRIPVNPASGVKLPRLASKERRYLDHDELATLAGRCERYELLVLVLGYCGLRWGEAAALRVKHVDLMRGRIEVAEAMTEVNGRVIFGTPKSHQRRSVPLPAFVRDGLISHVAGKGADDLVFSAQRGGVLRVGNFRRQSFDHACVAVGLGVKVKPKGKREHYVGFTPHELRHTAASLAIAAGASVKGVQAMLGHASATLTLDRYGHLFGDQLDAVAERIDAAARAAADNSRPMRGLKVVTLRRTNERDAV